MSLSILGILLGGTPSQVARVDARRVVARVKRHQPLGPGASVIFEDDMDRPPPPDFPVAIPVSVEGPLDTVISIGKIGEPFRDRTSGSMDSDRGTEVHAARLAFPVSQAQLVSPDHSIATRDNAGQVPILLDSRSLRVAVVVPSPVMGTAPTSGDNRSIAFGFLAGGGYHRG